MTFQQLQYIVALDTHRHFVKAAESCFVAQPTLTLQVKKLEQTIGLTIFDRSSQPLRPTLMGAQFVAKAREILLKVEELKQMVNDDREEMEGTFRIGIIPSLSPYLLPLFLKGFSDAFPKTHLEIKESTSEVIIESLEKNTLDIGILVTPLDQATLREIPIFYEPFLIYANQSESILSEKKITPSNLLPDRLWLLEQGHCFRNQILNLCSKEPGPNDPRNVKFESGSLETLKKMIQQLSGYTLIPELAFDKDRDAEFVRRFVEPEPAREVSVVVHQTFTKEKLINEIRKSIQQKIPKTFRKSNKFLRVEWR